MKIEFAFSTCPHDTFMFDAIINRKVDTEGIDFCPIYADIAKLNDNTNDLFDTVDSIENQVYDNKNKCSLLYIFSNPTT